LALASNCTSSPPPRRLGAHTSLLVPVSSLCWLRLAALRRALTFGPFARLSFTLLTLALGRLLAALARFTLLAVLLTTAPALLLPALLALALFRPARRA
jgi:hypothetical protein